MNIESIKAKLNNNEDVSDAEFLFCLEEQGRALDALQANMNGGITDAQREISEAANDKDYNDSKTDLMIKLLEDVIRRDKVLLNAEVQELYNEHDENDKTN